MGKYFDQLATPWVVRGDHIRKFGKMDPSDCTATAACAPWGPDPRHLAEFGWLPADSRTLGTGPATLGRIRMASPRQQNLGDRTRDTWQNSDGSPQTAEPWGPDLRHLAEFGWLPPDSRTFANGAPFHVTAPIRQAFEISSEMLPSWIIWGSYWLRSKF